MYAVLIPIMEGREGDIISKFEAEKLGKNRVRNFNCDKIRHFLDEKIDGKEVNVEKRNSSFLNDEERYRFKIQRGFAACADAFHNDNQQGVNFRYSSGR